jgi:hypothetical protein
MAWILSAKSFFTVRVDAREGGMTYWLGVSYSITQRLLDRLRLTPNSETPDKILDIDPVINYGPTVLDEDNPLPQNCNCPEKIVSQKGFKAVFKGLDPQEEYFPMVSRTDAKAFFGLPPKSLRPNAPDATMPTRSGSRENGNTPRFGDSSANYRRPFAVEVKDDDDFIEVDNDTHSDIYGASPAPRVPRRTRSESSGSIFHPPTPTSAEHSSDLSPVNRTLAVSFFLVSLLLLIVSNMWS